MISLWREPKDLLRRPWVLSCCTTDVVNKLSCARVVPPTWSTHSPVLLQRTLSTFVLYHRRGNELTCTRVVPPTWSTHFECLILCHRRGQRIHRGCCSEHWVLPCCSTDVVNELISAHVVPPMWSTHSPGLLQPNLEYLMLYHRRGQQTHECPCCATDVVNAITGVAAANIECFRVVPPTWPTNSPGLLKANLEFLILCHRRGRGCCRQIFSFYRQILRYRLSYW